MNKIVVASTNPIKINATLEGFTRMFPNELFEIVGVSVDSGVSNQPMSNEETYLGALNRAKNAKKLKPKADYWVGIEGGLHDVNGEMESFSWIVVWSKNKIVGKCRSCSYIIPKKVSDLVKKGYELGVADDIVFKQKDSKLVNGVEGILTGDVVTRTSYYVETVILALIPFKNPKLYK